jgi:dihydropyrimidinase
MIFDLGRSGHMNGTKTILIRGGTIVTHHSCTEQDVFIRGERIEAVGKFSAREADRIIDASGCLVMPGAVDTHVHFNDEFMNTVSVHDYSTGTRAAAFGGVTSIVDFANQAPGGTLQQAFDNKKAEALGKARIDWGVHPVITRADKETLSEIPRLVQQGAPTFKCYLTYRQEGLMVEEDELRNILQILESAGGMLLVHAEDNDLVENGVSRMLEQGLTSPVYHAASRPPEAENRAIARCIQAARETGGRIFIVHLASDKGLEMIRSAQAEKVNIAAETCTHYLVFTQNQLKREDGIKWICSPPLRDQNIQNRLWEGVMNDTISMVTSDDAAYSWQAKRMGKDRFDLCPNGIPGVEVRLALLYSEGVVKRGMSLPRLVELTAAAPARIFGLTRKGRLEAGADADIVLFDPEAEWTMQPSTLHMAPDWTAYDGLRVTGKVRQVISRGGVIINGDECLAKKGRGRYLPRKLNPDGDVQTE